MARRRFLSPGSHGIRRTEVEEYWPVLHASLLVLLVALLSASVLTACSSEPAPLSVSSADSAPLLVSTQIPTLVSIPPRTLVPTVRSTLAPTPTSTLVPALTPSEPTLVLGTATAGPGGQVSLTVFLDTGEEKARSALVSLGYDRARLISSSGAKGDALTRTWTFDSNSPEPGKLRFLAFDLSGDGQPLKGAVFTANFIVDSNPSEGDVPINVTLADVRNASNSALDVEVINGAVTVTR